MPQDKTENIHHLVSVGYIMPLKQPIKIEKNAFIDFKLRISSIKSKVISKITITETT